MFYSKRNRIAICIVLTIIIFVSIKFVHNQFFKNQKKDNNSNNDTKISHVSYNQEKEVENIEENEIITNQYKENKWRILISKINLDAPIIEGTSKEVLRRGVGHFQTTSKWNGNVVLAAHNRGYKYNFFKEIKNLEEGDVIVYKTESDSRNYKVIENKKIKETDFSCLENTNENTLTLITCLEDMPEYRTCIQAVEI